MGILDFKITKNFFLFFLQFRGIHSYEGTPYKPITCKVGDEVSIVRKITDDDLQAYAKLTGDDNAIHVNVPKIVHGTFLNGLVSGVMGTKLPGHGCVLVKQSMRFPHACYVDQLVTITVKVVEHRKFMKCNFTVFSHRDNVFVLEGDAHLFIFFRPFISTSSGSLSSVFLSDETTTNETTTNESTTDESTT